MKKERYEILRKSIVSGSLVSTTSQNWYDENDNLVPWSGSVYIGPNIGDGIFNYTGSVPVGYYKWNGSTWNSSSVSGITEAHQIPIMLECTADELGGMVTFDGDIEQIEQLCNFTYTSSNNTLTVYNSTNTNVLKNIVDATFTIKWGDNTSSNISILGSATKIYSTSGVKTVTITMNSPWKVQNLVKKITLPKVVGDPTQLGTMTFNVPYTTVTGKTQNYLNVYDYNANQFTGTTTFFAVGTSRLIEKKLYGGNNYTGLTYGSISVEDEAYTYTGYTFDGLSFLDLNDGTTYITGNTANFRSEDVFVKKLTRNEHYLGFIDEPLIFSDVFVERGKMGVSEFNLRLNEIDNVGELDVYGNGFYNVKKQ